jgi:hypothetical protein
MPYAKHFAFKGGTSLSNGWQIINRFSDDIDISLSAEAMGMEMTGEENYNLTGNLTLRGVTKPVSLKVEMGGIAVDPWGNTRAGFTLEGKINRKEFGLEWGAVTEAGGVVVADEVKLHASVQLIKQA